jgi:hypothetical protein
MKVIFLSIVLSLLIVFAKAGYHLNHNYGYGNLHMHGIYGYPGRSQIISLFHG